MDHPSGVQDEHPVYHLGQTFEVVGYHDQRQPGADAKVREHLDEDVSRRGVESRQWFVEDHQAGSAGDESGERGAAHLPAGEVLHPPVPKQHGVQADRGQRLVGGGGAHPGRGAYVSTHGGRQQLKAGVLHGQSDLAGAGGQRATGHAGIAFRRTEQTGEDGR